MEKKLIFGVLLASMLLIAGCPQEQPPQDGGMPDGGAPGGAMPQGDGQGGPGGEAPPQENESMGGEVPAAGELFDSWNMEEMLALGQPVHCTISYSSADYAIESEMWLLGEKIRVNVESSSGNESYSTQMVMKDNVSYLSSSETTYGMDEDCEWVMLDYVRLEECMPDSFADSEGLSEPFDIAGDYEETPDDYACEAGAFGDEQFQVTGKVCDFTEDLCAMYGSIGGGALPGMDESMCEGMTGNDYDECMELFN